VRPRRWQSAQAALGLLAVALAWGAIERTTEVETLCSTHAGAGRAQAEVDSISPSVRGVRVLVGGVAELAASGSALRLRPHQALRLLPLLPQLRRAYFGEVQPAEELEAVGGVLDAGQVAALRALVREPRRLSGAQELAAFEAEVAEQAGRRDEQAPGTPGVGPRVQAGGLDAPR
jgi:hypothetical protein